MRVSMVGVGCWGLDVGGLISDFRFSISDLRCAAFDVGLVPFPASRFKLCPWLPKEGGIGENRGEEALAGDLNVCTLIHVALRATSAIVAGDGAALRELDTERR
jgi:hypothetical protein